MQARLPDGCRTVPIQPRISRSKPRWTCRTTLPLLVLGIVVAAGLAGCPSAAEDSYLGASLTNWPAETNPWYHPANDVANENENADSTGDVNPSNDADVDADQPSAQDDVQNPDDTDASPVADDVDPDDTTTDDDVADDPDADENDDETDETIYYYYYYAEDKFLEIPVNTTVSISLVPTGQSSVGLSGVIYYLPQYGTLTMYGAKPFVSYTPKPGFKGYDWFAFYLTDGEYGSNLAYVDIIVGQ